MLIYSMGRQAVLFIYPLMKQYAPKLLNELVDTIWSDFLGETFEPDYDWYN